MQKAYLFLHLITLSCLGRLVCGQGLKGDELHINKTTARQLVLPFADDTEDGSRDEDDTSVDDRVESLLSLFDSNLGEFNPAKLSKSVISRLLPEQTTTTTTTTHAPIRQLIKSISRLPENLMDGPQMINAPINVINGVMDATGVGDETALDKTAESIAKVTKTTTNLASKVVDLPANAVNVAQAINPIKSVQSDKDEGDWDLFGGGSEPYLSQECSFRIACELGKASRVMTLPLAKAAKKSKVVQDLQNRYTLAITYGAVNGHCRRFYCVMAQFLAGPKEAGKGVIDMTNRVVNPGLYETPL